MSAASKEASSNGELGKTLVKKSQGKVAKTKNEKAAAESSPSAEQVAIVESNECPSGGELKEGASGAEGKKVKQAVKSSKATTRKKIEPAVVEAVDGEKLTPEEENTLQRCEAKIQKGQKTFIEVGESLAEISEQRLYRETYSSFEAYCKEKWGIGKAHAYRQIDAVVVTAEMVANGDKPPEKESHARLLKKLPGVQRTRVMKKAAKKARGGAIDGADLKEAIAEVEDEERGVGEDGEANDESEVTIATEVSNPPPISLEQILEWVQTVRENVEEEMNRDETLDLLDDVIMALELMASQNDRKEVE